MTNHPAVYDVPERTGTRDDVSVDSICERIFSRAADPRTNHPDAHLDATLATIVDRYGESVVQAVIHRILVDGVPFRTAAADHDIVVLDGVRIGTVATQTLDELNTEQQA